jgi:ribonuclease R
MTDTDLPELSPDTVLATIRRRGRAGMSLRMLVAEVEDRLEIDRSEARRLLRGALRALEQQGEVVLGRGKRYFPADVSDLHPGRYRALAGGGFVVDLEAGDGPPVAIPPSGRRGALPGDRVLVRIETPRKRSRELGLREGVVVRVVERRTSEVVGVWVAGGGRPHVRPLGRGQRFSVEITSSEVEGQPDDGELVVVSVDQVEGRGEVARGALLARLGRPEDAGAVDRAVLRLFGIAESFDPEVAAQAEALPGSVGGAELAGRWDLRDRPAITIDGETARDFDDAVSARRVKGGVVEVEVHIADVAHYVRPGGLVDAEARRRGTSVYLPGLCVPMLPEKLSNDLCSLREGVDRLTFTVRFRVAGDGRVSRAEAHDSVIRSRRRCTYTEVFGWLERPRADWPEATGAFADSLEALAEAADRLGRARRARGSLDFDLAEPQILLDPEGRVVGIEPSARNRAHRLIEELMVAANTAVAMLIMKADQPCLHRVHDEPDPAKIETLAEVVGELGLRLARGPGELAPSALQALLEQVAGRPEEHMVAMLVLRSMARAVYTHDPRGHYALATDAYLHFTSPIRRYPDLVAHRMLRALLGDGRALEGAARDAAEGRLRALGPACSMLEQQAEKAERTAVQWKTALYLRDRVGEAFDGRISGVTGFGFFVELDEVFADGLVHVNELVDDYYVFDEHRHRLVGERTGRVWRLGDTVRVRLVRVDLESFQVQLTPLGVTPDRRAVRAAGERGAGRTPRPKRRSTTIKGRKASSPGRKASPPGRKASPPGRKASSPGRARGSSARGTRTETTRSRGRGKTPRRRG